METLASAFAGNIKFEIESNSKEIIFQSQKSGKPVITWRDNSRSGRPVDRVTIGNISPGKRILSGSEFKLYPDRLGEWDYDMGFRAFSEGFFGLDIEKKKEIAGKEYPYIKRLHDPVKPFESIRVYPHQVDMLLHRNPRAGAGSITYPLDFSPDFEVVGIVVRPWNIHPEDGTGDGGSGFWRQEVKDGKFSLTLKISLDAEGKKVIAEKKVEEHELRNMGSFGSISLPVNNLSRFFVTLELSEGTMCLLAGGGITAYLRYTGNHPWPEVSEGKNTFSYSDTGPSPGKRELNIILPDSECFPGFMGDLSALDFKARNCRVEKVFPVNPEDNYLNKSGYLQVSELSDKRDWSMNLALPEKRRDWRNIKDVRITYRVPTWCGRIQLDGTAIYGAQTSPRHLPFGAPALIPASSFRKPQTQWYTYIKHLPDNWDDRGNIIDIIISSWGPTWEVDRQKELRPFCLEIGAIELVPFSPGEKDSITGEINERKTFDKLSEQNALVERLDKLPLPVGSPIKPREMLLRGFWGMPAGGNHYDKKFLGCSNKWDFIIKVIEDFKSHHLNAAHFNISNLSEKDLERFVKLAHENGIRLWGCYSFSHNIPENTPIEYQQQKWNECMVTWEKLLSKYADCPVFVAWAVGEEPSDRMLPFLQQSRDIIEDVGSQPQIMIYNNGEVMLRDCETDPRPGGAAFDDYVFLTLHIRLDKYINSLKATWEAAKKCNGVAWFVPQMVGRESGHAAVYRSPTQAEMRFQVWTAIAYNVKGFFPWMYLHGAKKTDFTDTSYYRYYAEEMGRLALLEKLIIAMERDDDLRLLENKDDKVLIGNFKDRHAPVYRFAVIVNLDTKQPKTVNIKPVISDDIVTEIFSDKNEICFKELNSDNNIEIAPGNGQIFFIGPAAKAEKLRKRYQ